MYTYTAMAPAAGAPNSNNPPSSQHHPPIIIIIHHQPEFHLLPGVFVHHHYRSRTSSPFVFRISFLVKPTHKVLFLFGAFLYKL
ncbi:hypothetical protein DL93DRAFT_794875 [Clavulina sp. PMI_390]|nr:hypothetical protein DL93DRAFT_794875 [Clavulina sp. PMI_390]